MSSTPVGMINLINFGGGRPNRAWRSGAGTGTFSHTSRLRNQAACATGWSNSPSPASQIILHGSLSAPRNAPASQVRPGRETDLSSRLDANLAVSALISPPRRSLGRTLRNSVWPTESPFDFAARRIRAGENSLHFRCMQIGLMIIGH